MSGPPLPRPRLYAALPLLTIAFTVLFAYRRLDDYDTWWHLASGRWIAQHGTVPQTDVLSFTVPDHPWINLQWAYDLALYGLFRIGGPSLLVAITGLLFGLAIALVFLNIRRHLGALESSVLASWIVFIASERFAIRPEVVTLVLLQALLWVLESARRDRGRRLWLMLPLMVLWVNTHALFIIGLFIISCYVVVALASPLQFWPAGWRPAYASDATARRRLVLAAVGSALVTVLNPYHVRGILFPMKLLSRIDGSNKAFQAIGEFVSPFSSAPPLFSGILYRGFFLFAVAVILLAGARAAMIRPRGARSTAGETEAGFDMSGLLVFAGLACLSLLARRNMGLFAMGVAPFLGKCLHSLKPGSSTSPRPVSQWARAAAAALALVLVGSGWFVASNGFYRWSGQDHEFGLGVLEVNFPIKAATFVREMNPPGRLFCDLTSGGYLTWDGPIEDKVYIDGRLEVYDNEFFSSYLRGLGNPELWQAQAERAGIGYALISHRWPIHHALIDWLNRDPRWALVYVDETAAVFFRAAGNEQLIRLAREHFASGFAARVDGLLRRAPSWQWPSAQVIALSSYADALTLLGNLDPAAELYSGLLGFDLPGEMEARVRVALARLYALKGETALAREQLDKAAAADPDNPEVGAVRAEIGH